jgi:uncharacterized membrane protein
MAADAPIQPPEAAPHKPRRSWLYASIALNLLLVGVVAGSAMAGFSKQERLPKHPPMAMRDVGFAFLRALPEERRKQIFKRASREFGGVRPLFEESMAARKDAFALLEQETITPAQLKEAFGKVQAIDAKAQARASDMFANIVADIPVEERRAAVEKMRERAAAREKMRWRGEGGENWAPPHGRPPRGLEGSESGPSPMNETVAPGPGAPPPP